jgi:hypothetical protein
MKLCIFAAESGFGRLLAAQWSAREPERQVEVLEFPSLDFGTPESVQVLDPNTVECFVATGPEFLNVQRARLILTLQKQGLRLANWIGASAIVHSKASIGQNCWIDEHTVIGADAVLEDGVVINSLVSVGLGCKVGAYAWLESGAILKNRSQVGRATTIGPRVVVGEGLSVGEYSEISIPGYVVERNIAQRTFLHSSFDSPVEIISAGSES